MEDNEHEIIINNQRLILEALLYIGGPGMNLFTAKSIRERLGDLNQRAKDRGTK